MQERGSDVGELAFCDKRIRSAIIAGMKILRHCLNVTDRSKLLDFYSRVLGMRSFASEGPALLGYDPAQCLLELAGGSETACRSEQRDFYWKIGITVRDLDIAVAHVRREGWSVSDPVQFRDIGYLCHLRDPDGFAVELLQQGFEGRAKPIARGHPIGGQATLAHLTLRVTDLDAAREVFENRLGMRLMSVQPVSDLGFCLYFYGWSDDTLPDESLTAVENREWLWARPYTLVELQHLELPGTALRMAEPGEARFCGIGYAESLGDVIRYVSASSLAEK